MAENHSLQLLESSIDRLGETEFHFQLMERHYHFANPFRWSLNSFLRALKEIPQIIRMELQNQDGFKEWFTHRTELVQNDPLISHLGKQRDIVVHRKMLKPASTCTVGITEGRGIKFGLGGFPMDPLEDSDSAILKYLQHASSEGDYLSLLGDDEESLPCVEREWKLATFPNDELTDLASQAWHSMAELVAESVDWLSGEKVAFNLERGRIHKVRIKMYSRELLRELLAELTTNDGQSTEDNGEEAHS